VNDRKQVLLRIDPAVHDALARWAADEFRSLNAQVEMLLRRALEDAGRMPKSARAMPRRGRPPSVTQAPPALRAPARRQVLTTPGTKSQNRKLRQ
jgi:hypothetical protein